MNNRCPLTSYVIVGFSQGAVIAGDIASDIGNGRGPIDQDLVLGVTLIADGRRQDGVGQDIGPNPPGQGAEITLQEVPTLSALGLTMTGPRPGGFGALNDRTNQICGAGDLICAAPGVGVLDREPAEDAGDAQRGGGPRRCTRCTTPRSSGCWTARPPRSGRWDWAQGLIDNAPHPQARLSHDRVARDRFGLRRGSSPNIKRNVRAVVRGDARPPDQNPSAVSDRRSRRDAATPRYDSRGFGVRTTADQNRRSRKRALTGE